MNKKNIYIIFTVFTAILMLVPPTMGRISQEPSTINTVDTTVEEDTCPLCASELSEELTQEIIDTQQELIILDQNGLIPEEASAQVAQVLAINANPNQNICDLMWIMMDELQIVLDICFELEYYDAWLIFLDIFETVAQSYIDMGCNEWFSVSSQSSSPIPVSPTTR